MKRKKQSENNKNFYSSAEFYSQAYADMGGYALTRLCIGKVSVYFMLVLFPLITAGGYVSITACRARTFIVISWLVFGAMLINEGIWFLVKRLGKLHGGKRETDRKIAWKSYIPLILAGLFGVSVFMAWLFSSYKTGILTGADAKYVGVLFMSGLAMMYAVVSRCYRFSLSDIKAALAVGGLVHGLAVIHFLGGDPFHWFSNMVEWQRPIFISTFGNIDVYGMYAVFTAVMTMVMFFKESTRRITVMYGILLALNFMGVIISDTDAAALAILLWLLAIPVFMENNAEMLKKYCQSLLLLSFSALMIRFLDSVPFFSVRELTGLLSVLVFSNTAFIVVLSASMTGLILSKKNAKGILRKWKKRWRSFYLAAVGIILAGCMTAVSIVNLYHREALPAYANYLLLDENWGSGRGAIWSRLTEAYGNMPIIHKLFGAGETAISNVLIDYTSEQTSVIDDKNVNNAHNIFLQLLITQGIAGISVFIAICLWLIHRIIGFYRISCNADIPSPGKIAAHEARKKAKDITGILAVGMASLVCIGQCTFCLLEPIAFPIVFSGAAIANSEL